MKIIPEVKWKNLIEDLNNIRGASMIIGATDSGKSSLLKYLLKELLRKNLVTSVIDSDVGQSSLGLPGTVCMRVFYNEHDFDKFTFEKMSFVGTINPAMNMSTIISITSEMTKICRENSDFMLIDTSGLISGEIGKNLKILKIKSIQPEHIIALQRENELENILNFVENSYVHRIPVSRMVQIRTREERILYRKLKFKDYFSNCKLNNFIVSKNSIICYYKKNSFIPKYADCLKGKLIGLNYNDETKALGIVNEIDDGSIIFTSPIDSLKNINKIIFGDMKI